MALTCCVKSCSNGSYWLKKWKSQLCDVCGCLHKEKLCSCEPPFRLFTFPTKIKNPERREKWKQLVGRSVGSKLWSPPKDSRICSRHFIGGEPTLQNQLPTLHMGYEGAEKRVKRMTLFEATKHKPTKKAYAKVECTLPQQDIVFAEPIYASDPEVESMPKPKLTVPWIFTILALFLGLCNLLSDQKKKIAKLQAEVDSLKKTVNHLKHKVYCENIITTDSDTSFYTGMPSKGIFNKLHAFISPFVNRRWTGLVSVSKNVRKFKLSRFGPSRKLTSKSEFLMMLMKLRLGLLNKDLAKRFDISETLCSRIFFSWLRATSTALKSMVYIPEEESLIGSKPLRYRQLHDLHSIIDCTEIFIETPKDMYLQSATWSDYKHHNTLKILVSCAPNSSIVYVSPAYLGRISDKALTLDCGYLDMVPFNKMVMADKGFNISNECAERNITLYVPPGKRGHSQMSMLKKQKELQICGS
ncbi:uncharacterized protein LOC128246068 [Mya arenaria]|uniref:uncharacterized protein LOC128246068 n=1 Tax=Mya arenaria TaxID=6604 RepID=UPI0022E2F38B|nr:uncharacterized protein LOC128246068 [Mya arenaria]